MLRSSFFAVGMFVALWGVSFLFIDTLTLKAKSSDKPQQSFRGFLTAVRPGGDKQKVVNPPEWAAFSLMSIGTVTMLYAAALPKRHE